MRKTLVLASLLVLVLAAFWVASASAGEAAAPAAGVSLQADPACPGSLVPRLVVGQQGRVARVFSSLRSSPAGPAFRFLPGGSVFTVLAAPAGFSNPTCASNNLWYWYIDYGNGVVGWANESQVSSQYGSNLYWLEPFTPTPTPPVDPCAGSLPTQFGTDGDPVGEVGQIAERFSTLRSAPAGAPIRFVFAPATFTILEGPVCAAGLVFYRIDYGNGMVGWANESQKTSIYGSNKYWLEPIPV
jgi:hypothetical protein